MKLSKNTKSGIIAAALAMATTGVLTTSQTNVDAALVATTYSGVYARLYIDQGKLITNRELSEKTPWAVGKILTINNETMYQVATNEYLRAADANLSGEENPNTTRLVGTAKSTLSLYNRPESRMSKRTLPAGTSWAIGDIYTNKDGQTFVQVSGSEYADAAQMNFNQTLPAGTRMDDFAFGNTFPGSSTSQYAYLNADDSYYTDIDFGNDNQNSNGSTTTETNTNNNSGSTDTTTPSENNNTNTDQGSYKPDINKINDYFVKYLNALHAANGTAPVQSSSDMISYATQRANQQNGQNLDHTTATKDTSENLSSAGFNYMNYAGVHSDKDAAYFLLKEWYDEDNNYFPAGQAGHYGHRAALIYSGPTVGLGINDNDAAFDADWNNSELDAQNQLYNYTGSNPNTKFISKDAI